MPLTLRRPDDWHVHLRDGAMLRAVLPFTARVFARAVVMPNLDPPVVTAADARSYRERVVAALPPGIRFVPLMTAYLTDRTDPDDLARGHAEGVFAAAKLYPAGATTNSESGVTSIDAIEPVLERMERIDMPLLVHGEVTDPDVDVFDREAVFLERTLAPTLDRHPALRIVLEHVTTADGVAFVRGAGPRVGATVTPHHLVINRNAMFAGGLRHHMYCLPVAKRERHRLALREAVASGEPSFFLGTDSAPHSVAAKHCGCAGIFNAPTALETYAQVFDKENALDRLEAFASLNGPAFYGLEPNADAVTLERGEAEPVADLDVGDDRVVAFPGGRGSGWRLARTADG